MIQQSSADIVVYFNVIWKRLWLTILLVVVTVGVILSISYTAKPVYRATVRLQVLATDRSDVSLFSTARSSVTADEIGQAQNDFIRALTSGFVAWQTIADLNLDIGAVDLLDGLNAAIEGDFIVVVVESDDPGRAEAIATSQVNNALEYYRQVRATPSRVLRDFVSGMLAIEKQNVLKAEADILAFKQKYNLDSIKQESESVQNMIRNLKLERDRMLADKERADSWAKTYREAQKKTEATAAEIDRAVAPETKGIYQALAREYGTTALRYEAERDGIAASLALFDRMIAEREEQLRALIKLSSEYNALEQELGRATSNYDFLWAKENEARLKQAQAEKLGYIQITEPARKPDAPVPSKTPQLLMVGVGVSVLVGFVLSFFLEFLSSLRRTSSGARQRVS